MNSSEQAAVNRREVLAKASRPQARTAHGEDKLGDVAAKSGVDAEEATLIRLLGELMEERCKLITHVNADGARWIALLDQKGGLDAIRCKDNLHGIQWATDGYRAGREP